MYSSLVFSVFCFVSFAAASKPYKRQLPASPNNMTTIKSPNGAEIRYKQPGKDGVCETTPGVNSYSGYISLNATTNSKRPPLAFRAETCLYESLERLRQTAAQSICNI
jgi:hypothetical protein